MLITKKQSQRWSGGKGRNKCKGKQEPCSFSSLKLLLLSSPPPVVWCARGGWLSVVPAVTQVALSPRVWPRVLIMWLMRGGGVGVSSPEEGVTPHVPVPGGGEGDGGGPVHQLLQHLLAGHGEAPALGGRAVPLALDGLGVGVAEDRGQDTRT